jgi:hypothetical protein
MWYWRGGTPRDPAHQSFSWSDWKRKLTLQTLELDNDRFDTNAVAHPQAGVVYYQIARGNGLGFWTSYVSTFLASAFWEYVVEYVEVPSLNDLVMTPVAGTVVGESSFRLGRLFAAGRPSPGNLIGQLAFSPVATLNDLMAGRSPFHPGPLGSEVSRGMYHLFALGLGAQAVDLDAIEYRQEAAFQLDGVVVAHPGYRRPGRRVTAVRPGEWTRMALGLQLGTNGVPVGYGFHSSTVLWGRYLRSVAERDPGADRRRPLRGTGLMLGLGSSFDYQGRDLPGGWERLASAGLLGPAAELTMDGKDVGLRLAINGQYSLGLMRSPSYAAFGPLGNQVYYHAHGLVAGGALALRLWRAELGLGGDLWALRALKGAENRPGEPALADIRRTVSLLGGVQPFHNGRLRLTSRLDLVRRSSRAFGTTMVSYERRVGLAAILLY